MLANWELNEIDEEDKTKYRAIMGNLGNNFEHSNGNFPKDHNSEIILREYRKLYPHAQPIDLFSICTNPNHVSENFDKSQLFLKITDGIYVDELIKSIEYYVNSEEFFNIQDTTYSLFGANILLFDLSNPQHYPFISLFTYEHAEVHSHTFESVSALSRCLYNARIDILLYCRKLGTYKKNREINHISRNDLGKWKKQVIGTKCVCCGSTKHLEAHHIYGFNDYNDLADDPNNGITLCKFCHKKYHSEYGRDNANPKDLIEFMQRFTSIQRLE